MAKIDDVKTMLTSLLKASPSTLGTKSDNKSEDINPADGFDSDNPLAYTDLYRDEQGNRLPSKLPVIPLFGNPVLPTQLNTLHLNIEWLDVITEVINSSHHTFALFAVNEDKLKRELLSLEDFPKTGTVVRLLSARAGAEEIDIVCEGLRRVSLIEVADPKLNIARVRYPEIEYRLANPNTLDKIKSNNKALKKSISRAYEFDKKIHEILKEQYQYARSIGVDVKAKLDSFEFDYFLHQDENNIGRISRNKLQALLEFIGLNDLKQDEIERIALYLARPSQEEMDKLNNIYLKACDVLAMRSESINADIKKLSPASQELAQDIIDASFISENISQAAKQMQNEAKKAINKLQEPQAEDRPKKLKDISLELKHIAQDNTNLNQNLFLGSSHKDPFIENQEQAQIAQNDNHNEVNENFINKIMAILDNKNDDANSSRSELFDLIAQVGRKEELQEEQNKEKLQDAAIASILEHAPKDNIESENTELNGPSIGILNEDTTIVTFKPGEDTSEDLLLRLTEIEKMHEQMLEKEAQKLQEESQKQEQNKTKGRKKHSKANKKEDSTNKLLRNLNNKEAFKSKDQENIKYDVIDIKDDNDNLDLDEGNTFFVKKINIKDLDADGGDENKDNLLNRLKDQDNENVPDSIREFLKFLITNARGDKDKDGNSWSALQRAALIRSKLAHLLGGKVVFGVSDFNLDQNRSQKEVEIRAYCLGITTALQELLPLNPMITEEMRQYFARFDLTNPSILADCAASITQSKAHELQEVLDTIPILPRLKIAFELITRELSAAKLQDKLKMSVAEKIQKRQKDFFLREQLQEIKKELGLSADEKDLDIQKFKDRLSKLNPPEHIQKRFDDEIQKLSMIEPSSPEYALTRNYIDILTTIPWGEMSKEQLVFNAPKNGKKTNKSLASTTLKKAREILDEDHEGLQDVKDRIIEFLAVGALKGKTSGQIMLFVGPPGVGKTSIGKSIAKALNRPFYRLSLGGIDDVSEIKGHRKTYVGAMPGKIVSALRETKVMNPVIMLDEIDKLGRSYHGDPDSALLETLDPEQNKNFLDVYLDEKLDLSDCLFICTANSTDTISAPLLDRMEPIRLSGYIAKEKFAIAQKHLIPRALENAGINRDGIGLLDKIAQTTLDNGNKQLVKAQKAYDKAKDALNDANEKLLKLTKEEGAALDKIQDALNNAKEKEQDVALKEEELSKAQAIVDKAQATLLQEQKKNTKRNNSTPSITLKVPDETIVSLIEGYARESGVRSLERYIAKLIRKAAVKLVQGDKDITITKDELEDYLGTAPFKKEKMLTGVGIMTGLAWTASGGVTLPVECVVTNHENQGFKLTGSLGDVMKESANIAYSYMQANLANFTVKTKASFFNKKTIHLHVPEGAIPKDGPSAGITMSTALLSLALNEEPKANFAMTGEMTLTGHVLPIGGLREKVIAARRMGIYNLIIPIGNEGDVKELPEQVRNQVTFYYADTFNDVAYILFDSVKKKLKLKKHQAPRSITFTQEIKTRARKNTRSKKA